MNDDTKETNLVQDINLLKQYYDAIGLVRMGLETAISETSSKYIQNGFQGWPSPNPFYSRTSKFIFLETQVYSNGKEEIRDLYTPFGQVKLLGGGWGNELILVSGHFLNYMDWEIIEVTNTVQVYNLCNKEKYGPFKPKQETWEGSGTPTKIYLITRIGNINFPYEINKDELVYFSNLSLSEEQYKKDKSQFKELSKGLNKF